jgi:ribosomal protein S18 acetylase RimI-like enzyme
VAGDDDGGLTLRPFVSADDAEVSSWFLDAGELRFFAGPRLTWPPDSRQWDLIRTDPTLTAWTAVLEGDDTAVGHGELVRESDELVRFARIAVAPALRGRGLGLALGRALLASARQSGFSRAALVVHPENTTAIRAYRSLGFVAVNPPSSTGKLWMELGLA